MTRYIGVPILMMALSTAPNVQGKPLDIELQELCDQTFHQLNGLPKDIDIRYIRVVVLPLKPAPNDTDETRSARILRDYLSHHCLEGRHGLRVTDPWPQLITAVQAVDLTAGRDAARERGIQALIGGTLTRTGGLYRARIDVVPTWETDPPLPSYAPVAAGALDAFTQALDEQSRFDAAWRSAVLPGWGQIHNDDWLVGTMFAVAQVAVVSSAIYFEVEGRRALNRYRLGTAATVGEHATARAMFERRNWALGVATGIWLLGIGHAWLGGDEYDPSRSFDVRLQADVGPRRGGGFISIGGDF